MEPLITLSDVHFHYACGRKVFDGVDFALHPGERVAITGHNGAGKTTLFHIIMGLRPHHGGEVSIFGKPRRQEADFREVRARVGLLFQDSDDQLFCPTVAEDVLFGPLNLGQSLEQAKKTMERTLETLGIAHFAERVTYQLSGGEKRIAALATVLAMEPEVLLLDEPTNGLDEPTEARILGILASLPQTMVVISHNRVFLNKLATRHVRLEKGRLLTVSHEAAP